jgi:hypothetical protein
MRRITKRSKRPSLLTTIGRGAGTGAAASQSALAATARHDHGDRPVRNPGRHLRGCRPASHVTPASREAVYALFGRADPLSFDPTSHDITNGTETLPNSGLESVERGVDYTANMARCFLRLANLPNFALDRLSRYEAALWRQAGQILFAPDAWDRRKSQERVRRFRIGSRQDPAFMSAIRLTLEPC